MRRAATLCLSLWLAGCSLVFNGDDLREDGGAVDAPIRDARVPDADRADSGPTDAGPTDAGPMDAGAMDASADGGPEDAGPEDAGSGDAGVECVPLAPGMGLEFVTSGVLSSAELLPTFSATMAEDIGGAPLLVVALSNGHLGVAAVGELSSFVPILGAGTCAGLVGDHADLARGITPSAVRLVLAQNATDAPMMQGFDINSLGAVPTVEDGDCIVSASRMTNLEGAAALSDGEGATVAAAFGNSQEFPPGGGGPSACLAVGKSQCSNGLVGAGNFAHGASLGSMVIGAAGSDIHYRSAAADGAPTPIDLGNLPSPPTGRMAAAQAAANALVVAPDGDALQMLRFTCSETQCLNVNLASITIDAEADLLPPDSTLLSLARLAGDSFVLAYTDGGDVALRVIDPVFIGMEVRLPSLMFDGMITDVAVLTDGPGPVVVAMTTPPGSTVSELHQVLYRPCIPEL